MAKMGTRKLIREQSSGEAQRSYVGFPNVVPANLIASPIISVPVADLCTGTEYHSGNSIMREGFTTDTGLLPSAQDKQRGTAKL